MNKLQIIKSTKEVLNIESKAINDLAKSLNEDFFNAVKSIESLKGKLIISGVGKSGNIASKIAAWLIRCVGWWKLHVHVRVQ